MKKYLAIIFALALVNIDAHASGKLITSATSYFLDSGHRVAPMVGLAIHEPLGTKRVALNSWFGYGAVARESEYLKWFNTSHFIETYIGRFTFGVGYKMNADEHLENVDHGVAVKAAMKLW